MQVAHRAEEPRPECRTAAQVRRWRGPAAGDPDAVDVPAGDWLAEALRGAARAVRARREGTEVAARLPDLPADRAGHLLTLLANAGVMAGERQVRA